jgi:hypothetical protein
MHAYRFMDVVAPPSGDYSAASVEDHPEEEEGELHRTQ